MLGKEGTKQGMPRGAWRPGASPAMAFNTDSNILAEGADPEKALWVFLGGGAGACVTGLELSGEPQTQQCAGRYCVLKK